MLDKTFDAANVEPQIAKKWDDANAFAAGAGAREGAEPFSIVIPPPNVTGSLHMGHALNNTLQDIMVRYQRMLGNNVLWQPGMDHAGIATQMVVERKLNAEGKKRNDFTRAEFIEKIWEWKAESGGTIFNQLKRLGASCDWSRERFTMDEGLSEAVLKVFVELYNEGLIYRGKRLVNWDPHFETAISDLEVENTEVDGHMWHFKYPLADDATYTYVEKDEDGNVVLEETRDYISIATTRPETMLGDGAVAVHPSDERYASIVGKLCEIPVGPKEHRRKIPIITDEYPDKDFGSGAVKITGAHDFNDYQVAKRNNIPLYRLMDTKASMRADGDAYVEEAAKSKAIVESGELPSEAVVDAINLVPDEYRGLDRFEARKKVIADISAEGLAVMTTVTVKDDEGNEREESVPYVENKKIMQPFGDRSKVVIEPMLTDQWFADAETLAKPALASVKEGRTTFVPKTWENTYYNWMENIQPWCISRQLWWGHQIPAWYGPDDRVFVAKNEGLALEAAIQHYISHEGPWKAWVENKIEASETQSILQRDPDVLDTWFSSALWPFSTLGWPEKTKELEAYYQTDVIVTGFDIIFFWVARMMMMGNHFMKDEDGQSVEPFHTVYVHALVRDKDGQKMSKSKGNVIDPLELMDEYGTDALRFTLAIMAAQGRDVRLDTDRIAGYRNFGTKLWNATRFAQMNDVAHDPNFKPEDAKLPVNRWILTELSRAVKEVSTGIDTYRFNDAASAAYKFVWNNFCDWYLELLKPVFQGEDEAAKKEAQACAAYVLDQAYKMLHPFMPFMTEELWGLTAANRETLICHAPWPEAAFSDDEAADEINWLIELVSGIRSVRAEMNVPPSAKAPLIFVDAGDVTRGRMERNAAAIQWLARVEALSVADVAPEGSAQIVVGESTACLPLGSLVDVAAESARIEKAIGKVRGDMAKIEGKLNNEKFVQNAKPEVVQAEREKLAEFKPTLENLEAALARVKAL
ncbi:valine--tRNA ligase [Ahrensia sp. 13_GOM-1096m]|uniref:valine--tRNA ligase n=1 Tax=Ahrensia sp. 13_GOM-1096m TaxID=1380380 RepID=UPI00047AAA7E|nr:valine--tRNA ligase [Ahrensia sp. 13_GOM-1096m]